MKSLLLILLMASVFPMFLATFYLGQSFQKQKETPVHSCLKEKFPENSEVLLIVYASLLNRFYDFVQKVKRRFSLFGLTRAFHAYPLHNTVAHDRCSREGIRFAKRLIENSLRKKENTNRQYNLFQLGYVGYFPKIIDRIINIACPNMPKEDCSI